MGFNAKNTYVLALMTIAFIIGEIAHFLLGKTFGCIASPLKQSVSGNLG